MKKNVAYLSILGFSVLSPIYAFSADDITNEGVLSGIISNGPGINNRASAKSNESLAIGGGASVDEHSSFSTAVGDSSHITDSPSGTAIGNFVNIKESQNTIGVGPGVILSNAPNSVAIGYSAHIFGAKNSVAIGFNSSVNSNNAVSLGNNSVAGRENTVSVGNTLNGLKRQITSVADGTEDSDVATVRQVYSAERNAKNYAKEVSDKAKNNAVADAKAFTEEISVNVRNELNKNITKSANDTMKAANTYTDRTSKIVLDSANQYTDKLSENTLVSANSHSEYLSKKTLDSAVNYTAQLSKKTLIAANDYTDSKIKSSQNKLYQDLRKYTDQQDAQLNDRIEKVNKKIDKGLAASAALTGLFQPYGVGKINFTAGIGGYRSTQALAIGSGYRVNENTAVKAGVALSDSKNVMYNASFNLEW